MQQFARTIGYLSLIAGALLVAFPETSRRLIEARAEFARLSTTALRFLGSWYLLTGLLLVSVTAAPTMEEKAGEIIPTGRRKAA